MEEKILSIWLSEILGPGSSFGKILLEKYGSFEEIYRLSEKDYIEAGMKPESPVLGKLTDKNTAEAEKSYAFCEYNYFNVIEYTSALYPERLKAIKNPPPVLYARGRMINFDDNVCIGVVGTRSYTDAGWNSTYKIAGGLSAGGAIVVTGLASGIDTAATKAALASSGFAVGIIGSGLEKIYPAENRELFEEMYVKGLVISERVPFTDITGKYFPIRNRIISGLCNGVLVGEGNTRSGAMITASHASEQGRRVFAIPGDISGQESTGVNKLIREGATPVFEARDVLEQFVYLYPHRLSNSKIPENESIVVPEERSTKKVRTLKWQKNTPAKKDDKRASVKKTGEKKASADKASGKQRKELVFEKVFESDMDKLGHRPEKPATGFDIESLGELEKKVYLYIAESDFRMTDSIAAELSSNVLDVTVALTTLELAGLVETEGPKVRKVR
ncbi:MAG: DNA-processing protein DprA [Clostridia bacterium]|nr:DNA-processing protein DprA [Clostridia bacterium]